MKQHPISPLLVAFGFLAALFGVEKPGRSAPLLRRRVAFGLVGRRGLIGRYSYFMAWIPRRVAGRHHQVLREKSERRCIADAMQQYKARGLGGVVAERGLPRLLRLGGNRKNLTKAVEAFAKLGMVVWIYDEEGYPSGSAGGLVVREIQVCRPASWRSTRRGPNPFVVRPAYEYTHASNNYYAARRREPAR